MKKIFLMFLLLVPLLCPAQWDSKAYLAFTNQDEVISGNWTFTGEVLMTILEVDTLVVEYIDATWMSVDSLILGTNKEILLEPGTYITASADNRLDIYVNEVLNFRANTSGWQLGSLAGADTNLSLTLPSYSNTTSWGSLGGSQTMLRFKDSSQGIGAYGSGGSEFLALFLNGNPYYYFGISKFGVPAGSVGSPAITRAEDTNTGMWFPGTDTLAFSAGGVEGYRIREATGQGWSNNAQHILTGDIDLDANAVGANAFSTTALADTIVNSAFAVNDYYFLTATMSCAEVIFVSAAKEDTLIVGRQAGTTSGLTYNWWRVK